MIEGEVKKPRKPKVDSNEDLGTAILQKLNQSDQNRFEEIKHLITGFIIALGVFSVVIIIGVIAYISTTSLMRKTHIDNINDIISTQVEIKTLADWENVPSEQKKSKLREHFNLIIQYYTNDASVESKPTLSQVVDIFNELY